MDIIRVVLEDPYVDAMMLFAAYASANEPFLRELLVLLDDLKEEKRKPIVTCLPSPPGIWEEERLLIEERKVPIFSSPERAINALAGLVELGMGKLDRIHLSK
jgi:acyl-CoA synthetase (NDP forming)